MRSASRTQEPTCRVGSDSSVGPTVQPSRPSPPGAPDGAALTADPLGRHRARRKWHEHSVPVMPYDEDTRVEGGTDDEWRAFESAIARGESRLRWTPRP